MPVGRVKCWNDDAGYGFIIPPEGPDVFVDDSAIQCDARPGDAYPRSLVEGQEVEYETREGRLGPMAAHVREPGQPLRPASADRQGLLRSGVQRFFGDSIRRIEYDINEWAEHDDLTVLSVSLVRIPNKGYGALVAYSRSVES